MARIVVFPVRGDFYVIDNQAVEDAVGGLDVGGGSAEDFEHHVVGIGVARREGQYDGIGVLVTGTVFPVVEIADEVAGCEFSRPSDSHESEKSKPSSSSSSDTSPGNDSE